MFCKAWFAFYVKNKLFYRLRDIEEAVSRRGLFDEKGGVFGEGCGIW